MDIINKSAPVLQGVNQMCPEGSWLKAVTIYIYATYAPLQMLCFHINPQCRSYIYY